MEPDAEPGTIGVVTLVAGVQPAGRYSAPLDVRALRSGVYFYQLETAGFREAHKLVIAR